MASKWRGYAKKTWEPLKHLKGAMDTVQTVDKTMTAAGRKLASAAAISNLSAKAACFADARKRTRAFLSAQSTVELSTHPILDHSGLQEAIKTLILKERVPRLCRGVEERSRFSFIQMDCN